MPLTLAIVQLFLLKEKNHIYGIPLGYVDEMIRIKASDIEFIKGRGSICSGTSLFPS